MGILDFLPNLQFTFFSSHLYYFNGYPTENKRRNSYEIWIWY